MVTLEHEQYILFAKLHSITIQDESGRACSKSGEEVQIMNKKSPDAIGMQSILSGCPFLGWQR